MLHPASSTAPCELHCTLWATLHHTELTCLLLSYDEALLSYTTPYWATLHPPEIPPPPPTELCYNLFNYAAPSDAEPKRLSYDVQHGAIQHTELRCTLLSYPTPSELCCTLLSYRVPYRASHQPVSYAAPYWATLYPTQLRCTNCKEWEDECLLDDNIQIIPDQRC
jgi:hypothetical protein